MNASDADEFKAMLQEVNAHTENDHWEVWEKTDVPKGKTFSQPSGHSSASAESILEPFTSISPTHIHGGKQKHPGQLLGDLFLLWSTGFHSVMPDSNLLLSLETRQIDFVLAFPAGRSRM
jgi:hypothetical protein